MEFSFFFLQQILSPSMFPSLDCNQPLEEVRGKFLSHLDHILCDTVSGLILNCSDLGSDSYQPLTVELTGRPRSETNWTHKAGEVKEHLFTAWSNSVFGSINFSLDCFPNLVLLSCDLILYWEKASEDRYLSFYLHNMGFPCGSADKESACNVGDLGLITELGRSLGEGKGYLLQYLGLENSMDCVFHGVAKSRTHLSDFHLHNIALFCRHFLTALLFNWPNYI